MIKINLIKDQSNIEMTSNQIQKSLITFGIPIMFSLLVQQLYSITDAAIVGLYIGDQGLAAVSNSVTAVLKVIINLTLGIQTGVQIIVQQLYGKKEIDKIQQIVFQASVVGILIGQLLTMCGIIFGKQLLIQLNIPNNILELQYSYLSIQFFGIIPQLLYNICFGIMRALGNSKRPMIYCIVQSIQNLVLDIYFVGNLKMGVSGAQLATVISQVLSLILILKELIGSYRHIFNKKYKVFSVKDILNVIEVGLPIGIQTQMIQIQHVIINSTISQFGTQYIIAWSLGSKVEEFIWIPMEAIYTSLTVFAGQNFGAGKLKRIDKAVIFGMIIQSIQTYTIFLVVYLLRYNILGLMTNSTELQSLQISILMQRIPFEIFLFLFKMLNAALAGMGKQKICMLILIQQNLIFRVQMINICMSIQRDFQIVVDSYKYQWLISFILFMLVYIQTRKHYNINNKNILQIKSS